MLKLMPMSWVTVVWSAVAGATLVLGVIHAIIWFRRRATRAGLVFSFMAAATVAMTACELWIMRSRTIGEIATAIRWYHVPVCAVLVSLVVFIRLYLRAGRAWLAWAVVILRTAGLVLNFLVGPNINFREVTGVRQVAFLGESVSVVEGVPNPLMFALQLSALLLAVFVADAAASAWRRGDRRPALTVGGCTLFFVVGGLAHSALVAWQIVPMPLMISLFYGGVVVAMSYETTREAFRAGALADDLRESEARYRSILERSSEGIYRASADGRILFANPATAKILGYDSPEELMSSVTDLASQVWAVPEERSRLIRLVEEGGAVRGHECQLRQKDGTLVWVSLHTRPFQGPDGRILYFDGIFESIDDRRQAEEALRKNRRLLEEMEKVGNVGGWEIGLDTGELTWTAEVYDIHEVDPSFEPTVEKGIEFYAPASRPVIERLVRRTIESGEPFDAELELITARGRLRNVHVAGRADQENRRIFGFFQDITSRKENEREMAELRNERAHLLRVLTVDELSTSLAHEINQPLGAILNNAEAARTLLSQGPDKLGAIPEIVEDIIQDARRAGDIIRKVRRVLKKSDVHFERLPVNGLIEETLEFVQNNLTLNNVTLRTELAPDVADIGGDRVRLQQVLLNLVTNALDAMTKAPSKVLTLRSAMDGPDTVTVSVGDSGPGIAEAHQGSVFQPFFTTKKGGLGLGLSICRSIIEEHEGRIWQVRSPDGGATFSFSLKAWRNERP